MSTEKKPLAVIPQKAENRPDLLDNAVMEKFGLRVRAEDVRGLQGQFQGMLRQAMRSEVWEDGEFMDDVRQATLRGAHPMAVFMFWMMATFLFVFLLWASLARVDEVSRGEGMVIPSGKVQAVGNSEGGVVAEILVKAGEIVEAGQELVRLDDTGALSGVGEKEQRRAFLEATINRLQAEVEGTPLVFTDELRKDFPKIVEEAQNLYTNRVDELKSTVGVLQQQIEQKKQELTDARRKAGSLGEAYKLAKQELDMTKPYLASGAISRADLIRLERQVVEAQKELSTAQVTIPAAQAALKEFESRLEEGTLKFKNEARDELGKAREEFNRLGESVKADEGRVERTVLKSPIRAEVKQVLVNTIGQAVQPNANIVELVPLDETLLVEAQIKPQDIAFIRAGLPANIKISAYDFSIFGGLEGKVESISPDSFTVENGAKKGETFYKIQVRTDRNYLERDGKQLPIKSGMVATVDVLTGKKTVLQYLLKPINKARERAFSER